MSAYIHTHRLNSMNKHDVVCYSMLEKQKVDYQPEVPETVFPTPIVAGAMPTLTPAAMRMPPTIKPEIRQPSVASTSAAAATFRQQPPPMKVSVGGCIHHTS